MAVDTKVEGNILHINGQNVPIESVVAFGYSLKDGMMALDRLSIPTEKDIDLILPLTEPEMKKKYQLTARQKWFVDERNRLVKLLGIRK